MAQREGRGGDSCEVQPQAGSPPRNGADARGRGGDGSGRRRGGTPHAAPPCAARGGAEPRNAAPALTRCRIRAPQPRMGRAAAVAPIGLSNVAGTCPTDALPLQPPKPGPLTSRTRQT